MHSSTRNVQVNGHEPFHVDLSWNLKKKKKIL